MDSQKLRITLASNANRSIRSVIIATVPSSSTNSSDSRSLLNQLADAAKRKLRIKKPLRYFRERDGLELFKDDQDTSNSLPLVNDDTVLVSAGEDFVGKVIAKTANEVGAAASVHMLAQDADVDAEAIQQLKKTAQLPGVVRAVGYPDLCPGLRFPVGASFLVRDRVYPELIGGDIGCGMTMYTLPTLSAESLTNPKKIASRIPSLDSAYPTHATEAWLKAAQLSPNSTYDASFGTIGSGNHFAELQTFESIIDEDAVTNQLGIDPSHAVLLVHSGSRKLGKSVLEAFQVRNGTAPSESTGGSGASLQAGTPEFETYLQQHDEACAWARRNREVIARRILSALLPGAGGGVADPSNQELDASELKDLQDASTLLEGRAKKVIDIWHNHVEIIDDASHPSQTPGSKLYIHRKGAAPATQGIVPIPGSRGAFTYLVMPFDTHAPDSATEDAPALESLVLNQPMSPQQTINYSLPHGAGRAAPRKRTAQQITNQYSNLSTQQLLEKLSTTSLGSCVVCEDKDLMVEEAPEGYKEIESVVKDVERSGCAKVVAVLKPVVTYKYRS